jgi:hypothetical protein
MIRPVLEKEKGRWKVQIPSGPDKNRMVVGCHLGSLIANKSRDERSC